MPPGGDNHNTKQHTIHENDSVLNIGPRELVLGPKYLRWIDTPAHKSHKNTLYPLVQLLQMSVTFKNDEIEQFYVSSSFMQS